MGIVSCVEGVENTPAPEGAAVPSAEELYRSAEDLVEKALRRLRADGVHVDEDDLRSCGRQGLLEAAQRFDPGRGDFRRFAYFRVRGAMIDGIRKMGNWSRRGYERVAMLRGLSTLTEALDQTDASSADSSTPDEAAERLRTHMASVVTAMTLGVFAEGASDGEEIIPRDSGASAEELVGTRQLYSLVRTAVSELPEPEGEIVRRHYIEGEKIDVIATEMGHTKSWASRIHTRAIRRLSTRLRRSIS